MNYTNLPPQERTAPPTPQGEQAARYAGKGSRAVALQHLKEQAEEVAMNFSAEIKRRETRAEAQRDTYKALRELKRLAAKERAIRG